ncbi:hypothetical protein [Pseudonocardia sp. N23]|uniref:hypothetical protein n=1 Tax=Pseudonocardia sp. N23 TaxID=1987376 RepID=UPI000BFE5443|nr:hypothetical protein [Pseudonocardia sp. N23]RTL63154.1 MAG: hypothetical protein EKK42_29180 [Pseudonocardiaceae bacterium]GAY08572.1 antifreeze glycopeptide AFGP polyprotein precursor [Pseudonocardia sp. N23]
MSDLLISALQRADNETPINGGRLPGAAAPAPAEDSDTASVTTPAVAHGEVARASQSANAKKIRAMRETLELRTATAGYHRELALLQRDRSRLDVLSANEERLERRAAQRVRGLSRRHDVATAVAAARLDGRERRAERQLAHTELTDQVWQRRALARRRRLLDPTSRLASLQRTHVGVSLVLMAVAVAGIAWTSVGVHDALVGPDGTPLAYIVEPLFSLPLLVIMTLHARAAQWGRTFPARENQTRIRLLEAILLLATMAINASPVLPVLGTWQNVTTLLAHLAPPVLIVVAIVLQPLAAAFLATILEEAHVEVTDAGPHRLASDTVDTLTLVTKVRAAIASGQLEPWGDTALPSVEAIRRYFGCEKRRAQGVHDALKLLTNGHHTGGASSAEAPA